MREHMHVIAAFIVVGPHAIVLGPDQREHLTVSPVQR
jgi:hypothetical protein